MRIVLLAIGFALFELVVGLSYASVDQNAIRRLRRRPAARAARPGRERRHRARATGYAGSGYLHPVALALQAAVAISMGGAPAREAEDGTAELVLSRPLPPAAGWAPTRWPWPPGCAVVVAGGYLGGARRAALTVDDLAPVDPGPLALAPAGRVRAASWPSAA